MSSELDRQLWDRIATIFDRALDAREAERAELLDQLCGSDETIRREVEGMLAAHEHSPGLIAERRLRHSDPSLGRIEGMLPDGARVGPYRIASLVGAGGMGDVYRAERADGAYRQTVALKVLRPGYRTTEMVRRFRIEREALARLVHPGIARILDGGALDDGRPYIVLEFVDGSPVTRYCDEHALSVRDRLALFLRIVSTVQFAHGRLVVHRDIKPSNILVQPDGTPRLLDFGIAKLLDLNADASLGAATTPEVRLLTPEYAAPEQIRGEPPSTATDVYSLGVLLFEMLTGAKPFPTLGRTAAALERVVLDTPAPAPSSVVAAGTHARALRGDLDRIVLMALRKEPERRYVSASQFGEDIERYLDGRPVVARPDAVGYRFGKFVRRNRALVGGGAALAILVMGFAITAALQARRISRERDRAERERTAAEDVLRILTGLFERADPDKHPGGDTLRVTSLLDDAEREVDKMKESPARQAALLGAVGRMRMARGEYPRGVALLTRAYEQRRRVSGQEDLETARAHHELGTALVWYKGETAARPTLDSSLTELRNLLGETHPEVRQAMNDLLMVTFDSVAARSLLNRLADLDQASPSKDPIAIAERLNQNGADHLNTGRYGEAVALFRAALDIVRRQLPPDHTDVRVVQRNLAVALKMDGQLALAESLQRVDLAVEERVRGPASSRGMAHEALALTLAELGRIDSAEAHERMALAQFTAGVGPENWRIWSAERNVAILMAARGRADAGLALLDTAIRMASVGSDSAHNAGYLTAQRAPFLIRLGRPGEAAQAIALAERRLGASAAVTPSHRSDVNRYAGMVELALGRPALAVQRFRAAVALEQTPSKLARPGLSSCLLGVGLTDLGQHDEAIPLLDAPCTRYLEHGPVDSTIVAWIARARARSGADSVSRRPDSRGNRPGPSSARPGAR